MGTEFVRIRAENGREVTISAAFAAHLGDAVERIDSPATNGRGVPLRESRTGGRRVKPRTTVEQAAKKKAAKAAPAEAPSEPGEPTTSDGVAVVKPQEASA